MQVLMFIVSGIAAVAWTSAAVHALMLVGLRKKEISVGQLMFGGYRFFEASTFIESARPVQRRFLLSVAAFALCVAGGIAAAVLATTR